MHTGRKSQMNNEATLERKWKFFFFLKMSPPECRPAEFEAGWFDPVASVRGAVSPELSGNKSTLSQHPVEITTTRQTASLSITQHRLRKMVNKVKGG